VAALVPSLLLARWTESGERLRARVRLLAGCFGGIFLFVLPGAILELTGGSWSALLRGPPWLRSCFAQAIAAIGALGLSAALEFESRGGGTPLPFDPPRRLVSSGLYAYVANPMQLAATLCLALIGLWARSVWVCGAAAMSVVYSAGLARLDEDDDLRDRFGESFLAYRRSVHDWLSRLRPYTADGAGSVLYVASECGKCSEVASWFGRRRLTGLAIAPAELSPLGDLRRVTYLASDGSRAEGVEAVARGLEHLHLGWALLGALARLPLLLPFLQLLTDASGGGPALVKARRDADPPP
jgi:protein-S-isoprenylcysteine O-methyltransferase Ste14